MESGTRGGSLFHYPRRSNSIFD